MTILATIIVLGVLIFVHELGHFAAAKAVGIEVQRFSIGLGPKVFGFTRGETEYVLSAIPLGGYVKMGGMDDEVMDRMEGGAGEEPRQPSDRDFDAKPIWARTLVISAGVIMNMVFAFGVYTFSAAQWGRPELDTTRIAGVQAETLPPGTEALGTVTSGSRFVSIGGREVAHWGDVRDAFLLSPPGPVVLELVEPSRTIEIRIPASESERVAVVRSVWSWIEAGVGGVSPGSPAERAGLEPGDRLVAVQGQPVEHWFQFRDLIEARPGERTEVTISRDGRELIRAVTLDTEETRLSDGSTVEVGRIGLEPPLGPVTHSDVGWAQAAVFGYRETVAVTELILGFLKDLVTGGISPKSMGSIVTIGTYSGQAAAAGIEPFLRFMAMFSINLAILNLLPIPVLDGGHLLFLAIEAVRGRSLSIEQRLRWSNVGFLVIVGIMLWALSNDFLRLLGL
jgi:regulator of sigma E protease